MCRDIHKWKSLVLFVKLIQFISEFQELEMINKQNSTVPVKNNMERAGLKITYKKSVWNLETFFIAREI